MSKMTVKEAKELCEKTPCTITCPLRDLCKLTADIGPTLEMWYSNCLYPDDKTVREVIDEHIKLHEDYLEGLRELEF